MYTDIDIRSQQHSPAFSAEPDQTGPGRNWLIWIVFTLLKPVQLMQWRIGTYQHHRTLVFYIVFRL